MGKAWKHNEKRLAEFFGTKREPGSGSFGFRQMSSGISTKSDSQHAKLFLSSKHSRKSALWTLFDEEREKAKAEKKTVVLGIGRYASPGLLLVIHTDDFEKVVKEYCNANHKTL